MNDKLFEKWNNDNDAAALSADVEDLEKNGGSGDRKPVPHGTYIVDVKRMELKENSNGDPMLSVWFRVVKDDENPKEQWNRCIFFNQTVTQPFQLKIADDLMRAMKPESNGKPIEVRFKGGYGAYYQLVLDVGEAVIGKREYLLEYIENPKNPDFSFYNIKKVFVTED